MAVFGSATPPEGDPEVSLAALRALLAEARAELRERAGERDRLFEAEHRARQAAEAALQVRDQVLAAVSHDLRNPLTVIRVQAQVLARRVDPSLPPDERERLEAGLRRILAETRKMARWIDELSDVARLRLGEELPLDRHRVDLVSLAERLAAEHQRAADQHRIRVEHSTPDLVGRWDEARLERVLDNLLANAVKYSPQGGEVVVSLSRAAPLAPPPGHDAPEAAWAILRVSDQGIGIPPADLPRIFEPFFRAPNAARIVTGTGLGLVGVRYIVERHGGTVVAESREGEGSTFTVRLPLDE